jgi:molecular chaperone HscB
VDGLARSAKIPRPSTWRTTAANRRSVYTTVQQPSAASQAAALAPRLRSSSSLTADDHDEGPVQRRESGAGTEDNAATAISPSTTINHFQLLGLPVSFDVDEKRLKASYLRLMMDAHPDKRHPAATNDRTSLEADTDFGGHPALEELASLVTDAFDALQKPHTRALHLLEIHNRPLDESSSTDLVGAPFLMDVMERRETISETSDHVHLQSMWRENKRSIQATCRELTNAFAASDLDRALRLTARLQYWNRIEETLREKMDSLE